MINLQFVKLDYTKSAWLKLAGYSAAIIVGLAIYHNFIAGRYSVKQKLFASQDAVARAKYAQYENLTVFKGLLAQEKGKMQNIISDYGNVLADTKRSQNSYLDQISQMSSQSNINLDKVSPVESNGQTSWDISFAADYKGACDFFSLLEKYFKIESFQITSGELTPKHKISVKVSSLAKPIEAGVQPPDKRDIFDLYTEADGMLKNIDARESEADSTQLTSGRDPMSYTQTIFPIEKKSEEKKKEKVEMPPVKIGGIYWDPSTPVVVIEGRALKEKDEYKGVIIDKINEKNIRVIWKGRTYYLKK